MKWREAAAGRNGHSRGGQYHIRPNRQPSELLPNLSRFMPEPSFDHRDEWQQVFERAAGKRVVLCDVFETMLVRRVHPEDIKRNFCARMCDLLALECSAEQLYQRRAQIERSLARREQAQSGELEIRVRDVHETLLGACRPGPIDARTMELLMQLEVECERTASFADSAATDALARLRAAGARVVFVSDFYLPAEVLGPLLREKGILIEADTLFVSCDLLKSKRSGQLYAHVLQQLGLAAKDMLMIGDNAHSDHAMAREHGIDAVLLDRAAVREHYERCRAVHHPAGTAARIEAINAAAPSDPFREVALALLLFVLELRTEALRGGIGQLAFMAREGQFLKRLFERVEAVCGNATDRGRIDASYLYVSRRSTFMPSLEPLDTEGFDTLFRQYVQISAADFLSSLGFSRDEVLAVCADAGCQPDQEQSHFPSSDAMRALLASKRFRATYEQRRTAQRAALMAHLDACGVMRSDAAVVDVGWKGTIQDNLSRVLPQGVVGYYLGLVSAGALHERNSKRGLLFDFRQRTAGAIFDETRSLFEVLLAADHGSVREYGHRGAAVEPVLEENAEERAHFESHVAAIQQQLYGRFEQLLRVWASGAMTLRDLRRVTLGLYRRLAYAPSDQEAALFATLTHYENFGVFRTTRFTPKRPTSVLERINPLAVYRYYRRVLIDAFWPSMQFKLAGRPMLSRLHALRRAIAASPR